MNSTQLCDRLRASLAADPLWDFAVALYCHDGIAAACLSLQDECAADICELLWRCWLEHHGLIPVADADTRLASFHQWQHEMTQPLRQRRRALKQRALTNPDIAELRNTLKQAELLAEREALTLLQRLTEQTALVRRLQEHDSSLQNRLSKHLATQKKHHLSTLQTLENCLDRLPRPR